MSVNQPHSQVKTVKILDDNNDTIKYNPSKHIIFQIVAEKCFPDPDNVITGCSAEDEEMQPPAITAISIHDDYVIDLIHKKGHCDNQVLEFQVYVKGVCIPLTLLGVRSGVFWNYGKTASDLQGKEKCTTATIDLDQLDKLCQWIYNKRTLVAGEDYLTLEQQQKLRKQISQKINKQN